MKNTITIYLINVKGSLLRGNLFHLMQFIRSRIDICDEHEQSYQAERRDSFIDHCAADEWSDDVPYIHDVGDIPIDESDILVMFADDNRLEYRTEYALKDITQSYESDEDSHIIDEECADETEKRS